MSETTTVILAILAIMIPILALLVGALYSRMNKESDIIRGELTLAKDTVNNIHTDHKVICQAHVDRFDAIDKKLLEHHDKIYSRNNLITELRHTVEQLQREIETKTKSK